MPLGQTFAPFAPEREPAGRRWRRYRAGHRGIRGSTELTALVNVGLLTAIFFIFDSAYILKPGFVVELPVADFVGGALPNSMVVTMTQEGILFFNDERMPFEGLGYALAQARQKSKDVTLTIEADTRVSYGTIARVMNLAGEVGIKQVNLATSPSFGQEAIPWDE